MANSWRAVAYGEFLSGPWLGEIATISISGSARDTGSYTAGAINQALPEFAAVPTGSTSTSTHFTWSFGSSGVGGWTEANQKAIGEAFWEYLDDIRGRQSTTFSWKEVRVSAIASDGSVVNGASVGTLTTPLAGTGTQSMPPQVAIVASMATGGRGPRNRGRLYVPAHTPTTTTGILIAGAQQTSTCNDLKTCINAMNAISGIRAAVVSRTHATYSDIVSIRCGDELDTQRRRRAGRKESYVTVAL